MVATMRTLLLADVDQGPSSGPRQVSHISFPMKKLFVRCTIAVMQKKLASPGPLRRIARQAHCPPIFGDSSAKAGKRMLSF